VYPAACDNGAMSLPTQGAHSRVGRRAHHRRELLSRCGRKRHYRKRHYRKRHYRKRYYRKRYYRKRYYRKRYYRKRC
jgi:hypothetical protein